jgi:hypothetical protein
MKVIQLIVLNYGTILMFCPTAGFLRVSINATRKPCRNKPKAFWSNDYFPIVPMGITAEVIQRIAYGNYQIVRAGLVWSGKSEQLTEVVDGLPEDLKRSQLPEQAHHFFNAVFVLLKGTG